MKSIWKSRSFITGLSTLITAIVIGYGIDIPAGVLEGILGLMGIILVGKSVEKRLEGE
ncbi:MAG: hypothetical protein QGG97_02495 [Flavobacteriales bacterium]|jgi:hypothetical protein|nr:hypothetical protein [Flavobacteriales bacterium]|tara:strand:+ start:458 stop:631 length:174 start_codon:yes stop_codon:yes gene_type:complete